MASPSELSLDCKPQSYSLLLKSFGDQTDQTYKLEEFLSRLEEERLKIDAFKRELPLCMQLLTNAVEASRQQLQAFKVNHGTKPILEEFIPMKHLASESSEKATNMSDKANWMTSAQLWSQASEGTKQQPSITSPKEADIGFSISPKLGLDHKQRNGGGAFLPFSKERNSCHGSTLRPLASSHAQQTTTTTTQTHRKARRCWSPDLHRRFVNALQMLGGSQVATPKQIRELMKVDGLTNDEVKSHLQKYRLHTRRPSPSQTGPAAPQLVVLGGIWVPPEYATAAAHSAAPTLYGAHPSSHAPPPHYCAATPVPQEFYTAAPPQPLLPPPPPHHNALHHLHMYKAAPHGHGSLESDVPGGGERSESIEDGKSESSSWKGESGENDGERKRIGEESNGSDITLKF
uniref:Two-component response regulator ARR18 n=1 Tax=Cajanus cajan TaxID=3821 RepID=A0A151SLE2_CAJCA|nr:Two-component response regulator ARR18 [Cajanus cajan]